MFESLKKRLRSIFSPSKSTEEKPVAGEAKTSGQFVEEPGKIAEPVPELYEEKQEQPAKEPYEEKKESIVAEMPEATGDAARKIEAEAPEEVPESSEKKPPEEKKDARKSGIFGKVMSRITEKKIGENEANVILGDLKTALLESDVAYEAAQRICEDVKKSMIGKSVGRGGAAEAFKECLVDSLRSVMSRERPDLEKSIKAKDGAYLILIFGSNGAGKTTTIAKLAHKFRKFRPVVGAGDTFRAASIEQLNEHSGKAGFDLVKHSYGADPAAVIFDARKHAEARKSKLVIGDTAGRSHSNANLMDELKKVVRVNKPDMKILVLDALTGNDIYEQSRIYSEAVGVDAIILTKTDVYDKGGACISASFVTGKPVLYLGTGQKYGDLEDFDADSIIRKMLD